MNTTGTFRGEATLTGYGAMTESEVEWIRLEPGEMLTRETSSVRGEEWYLLRGKAELISDGKPRLMERGSKFWPSRGVKQRLTNLGNAELVLFVLHTPEGRQAGQPEANC